MTDHDFAVMRLKKIIKETNEWFKKENEAIDGLKFSLIMIGIGQALQLLALILKLCGK